MNLAIKIQAQEILFDIDPFEPFEFECKVVHEPFDQLTKCVVHPEVSFFPGQVS